MSCARIAHHRHENLALTPLIEVRLHKRRIEYQQIKKYDTDFLPEGWT